MSISLVAGQWSGYFTCQYGLNAYWNGVNSHTGIDGSTWYVSTSSYLAQSLSPDGWEVDFTAPSGGYDYSNNPNQFGTFRVKAPASQIGLSAITVGINGMGTACYIVPANAFDVVASTPYGGPGWYCASRVVSGENIQDCVQINNEYDYNYGVTDGLTYVSGPHANYGVCQNFCNDYCNLVGALTGDSSQDSFSYQKFFVRTSFTGNKGAVAIDWTDGLPVDTAYGPYNPGNDPDVVITGTYRTVTVPWGSSVTVSAKFTDEADCANTQNLTLTAPANPFRWICIDGVPTQTRITDGSGYATEAECVAHCPETTPRWICSGGVCTLNNDAQEWQGYETQAECESQCPTTPGGTRYACTPDGCVEIGDAPVNLGYGTAEECEAICNAIKPEIFRWFCVNGECQLIGGIAGGYATQVLCVANCASIDTPGDPNNPSDPLCTVSFILSVVRLGATRFRASATLSNVQGTATVSFLSNGVLLTNTTPLSAEFDLASGNSTTIAVAVEDDVCSQADTRTVTNTPGGTDPNNPDPNDPDDPNCCPPGQFRLVEGGPCVDAPTSGALQIPVAPTVTKDCLLARLVVATPPFPNGATRLDLQREGSDVIIANFSNVGAYNDIAAGLTTHRYRARACNDDGCTSYGPWSAAISLASSLMPVWVAPDDGASPTGIITLIASAGTPDALFVTNPVTMKLFGGDLDVTYHSSANQYTAKLDTRLEYQGDIQIELQARDANGCYSLPVTLTLTLDNTLETETRWSEKFLASPVSAEMEANGEAVSLIGYYAKLMRDGNPDNFRYFRWWVTSPDPGAATPEMLSDSTAMEARVKPWQDAAFNDVTRLVAPTVEEASQPDSTARLCMRSMPIESMTLLDLEALRALKVRQTALESVEILTTSGLAIYDKTGLEYNCEFGDYDLDGSAIKDAARVDDLVYVAREFSANLVVINRASGKVNGLIKPYNEFRPCIALENWNGVAVALYTGDTDSTLYTVENNSFDDPLTLDAPITRMWVRENSLYLAVADGRVLNLAADATFTTIQSDNEVTALKVLTEDGEAILRFGDDDNAYERGEDNNGLDANTPIASNLGGAVSDLEHYKGAAPELRGALALRDGPNVSKLFLQSAGVYTPRWTLKDLGGALSIETVGLARLYITLRAPSGDPLKGGDAGLFQEILVAAFTTENGAFLARLQEADVDLDTVQKGRALRKQNFKRVRAKLIET